MIELTDAEREAFRQFTKGGKVPLPLPGDERTVLLSLNAKMLIRPEKGDMVLTHLGEAEREALGE